MNHRQRRKRERFQGLSGQPPLPTRNTLGSSQPPQFTFSVPKFEQQSSGRFRVPSPSDTDEEEAEIQEKPLGYHHRLPCPNREIIEISPSSSSVADQSDHLSKLGDSSSVFSINTPEQHTSPTPVESQKSPSFLFGAGTGTASSPFSFESPAATTMVVEREPPKATPQKPAGPFAFAHLNQPQFGKPSALQNRLQPSNIFNIPKSNQPRPEHHRPAPAASTSHLHAKDVAGNIIDQFPNHQPLQPRHELGQADVVEIPRPTNPSTFSTYPCPPPTFAAVSNAAPLYTAPYGYNYQKHTIDLTRPQDSLATDPAFFTDNFGAADPYLYINADKANENIKALLEGAFEDEEDKPRTRGRKKKAEATVEDLAEKLNGVKVKAEEGREEHVVGEEGEDVDDGTVEGLKVKLLPHQVDGVDWMRDKEVSVKKKNGVLPKGGILADDMGKYLRKDTLWSHQLTYE
ncbi:MAG: hypothetical protein Q9164_003056 [Protoblastenia rupestris]